MRLGTCLLFEGRTLQGAHPKLAYFCSAPVAGFYAAVDKLEEVIAKYGKPDIMNTDQGSQYTGVVWITTLTKADIKIPMDRRGRYLENIFIERL